MYKITCCVCSIERTPVNHWIMAKVDRENGSVKFFKWNDKQYRRCDWLCGEFCTSKYISRNMGVLKSTPKFESFGMAMNTIDNINAAKPDSSETVRDILDEMEKNGDRDWVTV